MPMGGGMRSIKWLILIAGLVLVSGCGSEESPATVSTMSADGGVVAPRKVDFAQIARGGRIYHQHCAECHGDVAQGGSNWRERDAEGKFPPPPLNGTGHAWHHPEKMLFHVIMNGSPGGQGNMPAWKGRLTPEEVMDVIAWFQSHWSNEIYAAWQRRNARP